MASRGGRGGSRGRGRGGAPGPVARDDEGNLLEGDLGPPPLFPELQQLPELPALDPRDERLLARHRRLVHSWKNGAFYLEVNKAMGGSTLGDVERYSDRYNAKRKGVRPALSSVMTLDTNYFPDELYTTKQKELSARASSARAQKAFWEGQARTAGEGLKRFEQLESLEANMALAGADEKAEEGEGEAGPKKEGEEEEEDGEGADLDLEDEEFDEEDDYQQGQMYDDDEGYDDPYDDGGGDDAIY